MSIDAAAEREAVRDAIASGTLSIRAAHGATKRERELFRRRAQCTLVNALVHLHAAVVRPTTAALVVAARQRRRDALDDDDDVVDDDNVVDDDGLMRSALSSVAYRCDARR